MTLAFLIISHRNPGQVSRLVHTLSRGCPTCTIVLHHDPTGTPLGADAFAACPAVTVLPRPMSVRWGDWTQVEATIAGLEWLLRHSPGAEWIVLLSGQDYPVRPLAELEALLRSSEYDGYIAGSAIVSRSRTSNEHFQRYFYHWGRVPNWVPLDIVPGRLFAWLQRTYSPVTFRVASGIDPMVGIRARRTPFSTLTPYKGGQWCMLRRRTVEKLVEAYHFYDVAQYFSRTLVPDEAFFHTILFNSPSLRLTTDTYRFFRFPPGSMHPDVLTPADLPDIHASGAFFARKFDEKSESALLDLLDDIATRRSS